MLIGIPRYLVGPCSKPVMLVRSDGADLLITMKNQRGCPEAEFARYPGSDMNVMETTVLAESIIGFCCVFE